MSTIREQKELELKRLSERVKQKKARVTELRASLDNLSSAITKQEKSVKTKSRELDKVQNSLNAEFPAYQKLKAREKRTWDRYQVSFENMANATVGTQYVESVGGQAEYLAELFDEEEADVVLSAEDAELDEIYNTVYENYRNNALYWHQEAEDMRHYAELCSAEVKNSPYLERLKEYFVANDKYNTVAVKLESLKTEHENMSKEYSTTVDELLTAQAELEYKSKDD